MYSERLPDIEETLLAVPKSNLKSMRKSVSLLTDIDYTKRVVIFIVLNVLGFILQFGSIARLFLSMITLNPSSFALAYSMGNLLSLIGMIVLTGFKKQFDNLTDPIRLKISAIFLSSMTLCVLLPLLSSGLIVKVLVLALVTIQMASYWMYTLSYFPRIQAFLGSSLNVLSKVMTKNN